MITDIFAIRDNFLKISIDSRTIIDSKLIQYLDKTEREFLILEQFYSGDYGLISLAFKLGIKEDFMLAW